MRRGTGLLVRGESIAATGARALRASRSGRVKKIDASGMYLAPGFIDLHTHGAAGVDFVSAGRREFARTMRHYLAHGVTTLLASLYPTPWRESLEVVRRVAALIRDGAGGGVAAGIHLEGPFLSPQKPGALPARNFRACSLRDAERLLEAGGGFVRTVTIAPELHGAGELLELFHRRGVVCALGHSAAGYPTARQAVAELGVRYATHLFNAMEGIHHRCPGAVTALLEDPRVAVEVISDGHHLDAAVLRLVNRVKPRDRVLLVSDSVAACGLPDGAHRFAGARVYLRGGRIARRDGTLAGSALTLDRAVAFQVEVVGCPLPQAVLCATRNPARAVGLERSRGALARGQRADLVLLDRSLRVQATWLRGREVFRDRGP